MDTYTLRVTSQPSYSPEYITPTQKKIMITLILKELDSVSKYHILKQSRTQSNACARTRMADTRTNLTA